MIEFWTKTLDDRGIASELTPVYSERQYYVNGQNLMGKMLLD